MNGTSYYDFPSIERLACDDVESGLREAGFGYRAAYISKTAKCLHYDHPPQYLLDLRSATYDHAKAELVKLHGVGAKVRSVWQ